MYKIQDTRQCALGTRGSGMERAGFLCSPGLQPLNISSLCNPLISQVSFCIRCNHFKNTDAFFVPTGWRRLQPREQERTLAPYTEQTNYFHTAFLLLLRRGHPLLCGVVSPASPFPQESTVAVGVRVGDYTGLPLSSSSGHSELLFEVILGCGGTQL